MQTLSPAGQQAVTEISARYNLSTAAVEHMLVAVNNGAGSMAQFNCPELGGAGQWMRGGMIMLGDMFNTGLKYTVDNLCNELSNLLATTQVFPVLPAGSSGSAQWWPVELGTPFSSGGQNNTRYAVFVGRLAVEVNGQLTVYDTLDHQIGGVSQQQGGDNSLTFSSQYGTLSVQSLPVISGANGANGASNPHNFVAEPALSPADIPAPYPCENSEPFAQPLSNEVGDTSSANSEQCLALIEKLAQLHGAGVLNDEEFATKKQELLARL